MSTGPYGAPLLCTKSLILRVLPWTLIVGPSVRMADSYPAYRYLRILSEDVSVGTIYMYTYVGTQALPTIVTELA